MREVLVFLAAAVICVPIAARFGMGSVLGYLIAGAAIGPWGLGWISDVDSTQNLAELGVVLMLFVIGLELDPRRLGAMRRTVFAGGSVQLAASGAVLGLALAAIGLPWQAALIGGLALALSSTAIATQTMNERNMLDTPTGQATLGILLFQDIAAIPLIALVPFLGHAERVGEAALALARAAVERIDLSAHSGVHPRLGAVDVVPFVPLDGETLPATAGFARAWGERVAAELAVPVFLYGAADPAGRSLPDVRRNAFRDRVPDFGPPGPHPTAGAVAVGARPVLVAVNCELGTGDVAVARAVARMVRERDGGLPGVRALGFALESKGRAQVSMNLTDLQATGVEAACEAVRRAVVERDGDVTAVELVGLLPGTELDRCSEEFLAWSGLSPEMTIETRLGRRGTASG